MEESNADDPQPQIDSNFQFDSNKDRNPAENDMVVKTEESVNLNINQNEEVISNNEITTLSSRLEESTEEDEEITENNHIGQTQLTKLDRLFEKIKGGEDNDPFEESENLVDLHLKDDVDCKMFNQNSTNVDDNSTEAVSRQKGNYFSFKMLSTFFKLLVIVSQKFYFFKMYTFF